MAYDPSAAPKEREPRRRILPLIIFLWVVILVLAAALAYVIWMNQSLRNPETQNKLAEQASQEIISSVNKLIVLPADKPTVATITDVGKLQASNAEFYKNARNGDSLLIYGTEAIIYRKSENRIIAIAPVIVNPSNTTSNVTTNVANDANVVNVANDTAQ